MEKEIIITRRSKTSIIDIEENDLPGEVTKIGVLEFGFDNTLFNLFNDNVITVGEDKFTLIKGHYEVRDLRNFFENILKSVKEKHKFKDTEYFKLIFITPILKFKFYNKTKLVINFTEELSKFLKIDSTIKGKTDMLAYDCFDNLDNRLLFIRCNNIKGGERYDEKNSKIILSHYVKSNFGTPEMEDYHKKIRYYDYIIQDNTINCVLTIMDEYDRVIDYTRNSAIYLKLSVIVTT